MTALFNPIDWGIISLILYQAIKGFRYGFIQILLDTIGILAGIFIGLKFYTLLSIPLTAYVKIPELYAIVIAFFILWAITFALANLVSKLVSKLLKISGLNIINRLLGFSFGTAKGIIILIPILIPFFIVKTPLIQQSFLITPLRPVITEVIHKNVATLLDDYTSYKNTPPSEIVTPPTTPSPPTQLPNKIEKQYKLN